MVEATLLGRLKRRLGLINSNLGLVDNSKDELLIDLLSDAEYYIKAYTGRKTLPQLLDGVLVELAAGQHNHLGLEGEASHSEGGISMGIDLLPSRLKSVLDMHRRGVVGAP